jgi:TIR domain
VFISYSRRDSDIVESLAKRIEKAGYDVWMDRDSTGPHRYAADIVRAIKDSRLIALMCSQNSFSSDHVIREVYVAGDAKKPFIVLQLDKAEFPDEILYFITGFPRVPANPLDETLLRSGIARFVAG